MKLKLLAPCVCISLLTCEVALAQTMPLTDTATPTITPPPITSPDAFSTPVAQQPNGAEGAPSAGPSLFGNAGFLFMEDLSKNMADKAYCAMIAKLSEGVVNNPELAVGACKNAAILKYENCLAANNGEETIEIDPETGRKTLRCAANKRNDLEVCDMLVELAEVFIEACANDILTLFPEIEPIIPEEP